MFISCSFQNFTEFSEERGNTSYPFNVTDVDRNVTEEGKIE